MCRPFFPPVLSFNFYRAWSSAIPLLVDFLSSVANSPSRAFRKSICAQKKLYTNLNEYALGGFELTKLTYTKLEDNLIRHRSDRPSETLQSMRRLALEKIPTSGILDSIQARLCRLWLVRPSCVLDYMIATHDHRPKQMQVCFEDQRNDFALRICYGHDKTEHG